MITTEQKLAALELEHAQLKERYEAVAPRAARAEAELSDLRQKHRLLEADRNQLLAQLREHGHADLRLPEPAREERSRA